MKRKRSSPKFTHTGVILLRTRLLGTSKRTAKLRKVTIFTSQKWFWRSDSGLHFDSFTGQHLDIGANSVAGSRFLLDTVSITPIDSHAGEA